MTQEQYERETDARARQVLETVVAGQEDGDVGSIWTVHARLALGRANADEVHLSVQRKLETLGQHLEGGAGPFHVLPAALLLRRWGEYLTPESLQILRHTFCSGVTQRGNTENHWLMYYTGLLLAAEHWAGEDVLINGRPPEAIQAEATRWILGTIERTARLGHHEYDSPGYHMEHMAAYVGLWDHARDPHLHEQVDKVLSVLVADMALEYFRGSWAGGHSREGYRQNTWTRVGPIQTLQYIYFGGEEFDPTWHVHGYAIPAAASAYRPPALFAQIALDRAHPHAVLKTRAPRSIIRHTDEAPRPVRKYTWMSRSFALGSSQIGLPGPPAGPIDLVSWDLTWHDAVHQGKITCNHPYVDPGRFSAFLGPLPQGARRQIGDDKPYLQRPDRLFGASPYERMVQHEGAILVGYRIPEDDENPFVNLFLPNGLDWVCRAGWLLADAGDFYVAVRPVGAYTWERIRESSNDSTMVRLGNLIDGWLLRVHDRCAALALEAVEGEQAGSFEEYSAARSARDLDLSAWESDGHLVMETHGGVQLEMEYSGAHRVDGRDIDYGAWPLYEAPGARAQVDTGKIEFRYAEQSLNLDFGVDAASPLLPMRVIG